MKKSKKLLKQYMDAREDITNFMEWCVEPDDEGRLSYILDEHTEQNYRVIDTKTIDELNNYVAVISLWQAMYHGKTVLMVCSANCTIFDLIREYFESLPNHLKDSATTYNKHEISFGNGRILKSAVSVCAGRGQSMDILFFVRPDLWSRKMYKEINDSLVPVACSRKDTIIINVDVE